MGHTRCKLKDSEGNVYETKSVDDRWKICCKVLKAKFSDGERRWVVIQFKRKSKCVFECANWNYIDDSEADRLLGTKLLPKYKKLGNRNHADETAVMYINLKELNSGGYPLFLEKKESND